MTHAGVPDRLRRSAAHVLVADVEHPVLDDDDHHHLTRVLRLRPGVEITVGDGHGIWRPMCFTGGHEVEPRGDAVTSPRPPRSITVAFAPTKGDRPEWVVQKLTELGIDRIVPLHCARSVVRWDPERADRQVQRWRRISREAASQSRRLFLPVVESVTELSALAAAGPVRFAEPGGGPVVADEMPVVVGPEGGFTDEELRLATDTVGLPGGVLRAETAALAVGVLMAAARHQVRS